MNSVNINSEVNKLKTVILHEPGEELNNLTPEYLGELLFDDIPWLPLAKKEHQAFAKVLKDNGVEVLYLTDLVTESLYNDEIKLEFIVEFLNDAGIESETLTQVLAKYLMSFKSTKEMVLKCISGIRKSDLKTYRKRTLTDYVTNVPFITNPIPNLYFTRDPFVLIDSGVSINRMFSTTRKRETIFGKYIFKYHPRFKDVTKYYTRDEAFAIEGGDILVLNNNTLIVGVSERTTPQAIERLAKNLFYNNKTTFTNVLAFSIPKKRTFMHLDTVFTQVDYDKFTIHHGCYNELVIYELTKDEAKQGKLKVRKLSGKLEEILEEYMDKKITLIPCGGTDDIDSDREQWSDGSNCLCIAPGVVITYERNDITNKTLEDNGIKVIKIPSSELSRGRGGPRCMSMPVYREEE